MKQKLTTKHKKTNVTLLLVVLLTLSGAVSSQNSFLKRATNSLKKSIRRNLADANKTFGGYTIKEEGISEVCDNFEQDEIDFTEEELEEGNDSIKKYFGFLQEPLREYLKTQDTQPLINSAWKQAWILINIIFMIVSLIAFLCFLFFFACQCCVGVLCCCCSDSLTKDLRDKEGDSPDKRAKKAALRQKREKEIKKLNDKKCTWCIIITTLLTGAGITVLGIIWSAYMFGAISGLERSECASSQFFSHIRFGAVDGDTVFIGLAGVDHLMANLEKSIDDLSGGTTIDDLALDVEATALTTSLQTFYDAHKADTVASCTGTGTATSDSISTMNANITDFIGIEFNELSKACNDIHNMAVTVDKMSGTQATTFKDSITSFRATIKEQDDQIVKFQTQFEDKVDTQKYSGWARWGVWVGMIGTLGAMIFFVIIAIFSLNDCCSGILIFLEGLLAIIKMFFAFLLNLLAIGGIVGGVAVCNFCIIGYDSLNDKTLSEEFFPVSVTKIFKTCLFNDSTGNLKDIIGDGAASDQVKELEDMENLRNFRF